MNGTNVIIATATTMTALLVLASVVALATQSPASRSVDLAAELAAKIAGRLAPSDLTTVSVVDSDDVGSSDDVRHAIEAALRAKGVRTASGSQAATQVQVTCGSNLRERACIAEIRRTSGSETVAAARPLDRPGGSSDAAPILSLDVRPVFAQHDPILDIAIAGDHLFVLQPDAMVVYQRGDAGWRRVESRAIPQTRVWPRDLRGRLWLDQDALDVRLPGVACRGGVTAALSCADENQPWPMALDNSGVDATRNYFTTREGLPFFAAAAIDTGATPRWVVADLSGSLAMLDAARQSVATLGPGDDVVALTAPCASAPHLLVSSPSSRQRGADTLRLLRVAGTHAVVASSPLDTAGVVTALWSDRAGTVATAIVRDAGGERYEALHIAIGCDR
jgi:hypothetical protein